MLTRAIRLWLMALSVSRRAARIKSMQITEIFRSIQGESTYAGLPCIFVRLTGCNLRCVWCDTAYAFYGGKTMAVDGVMEVVRGFSESDGKRRVSLVEITGGEPLLQK